MAKFVRYTCNKKNVPVMRKDCEKCSEYNPCAKDGKWCFVCALVAEHDAMFLEASNEAAQNATMPVMRDMSTVTINLGAGMTVDVLREDMKKQLERDLLSHLHLPGLMYVAWGGDNH